MLPNAIKSLRVLLVDDDEFVLEFVADMLHDLGIENVQCASDGSEALSAVQDNPALHHLLICDLNMPGMDGIEFLRHLAAMGFEGAVILSSGEDRRVVKTVENLVEVHKLRLLGTLEKPVQEPALLAMLMQLSGAAPVGRKYAPIQMLLPEEIRAGLDTGCLEVFFQPKVAVKERKVVAAECLARWRHPERGLLSPLTFITVAEQCGLINELTTAVFRKAVGYLADWSRQGHALKVAMAVNVSMNNLDQLHLPELLEEIAREAGIELERVTLEITESLLMSDLAKSLEILTRLRLKGFGLSIDDFGTGYSSMEKLKQLPFTELKIDRAFVFGAAMDDSARAILESSVRLGRALNMKVVAEGVETQEDWDIVAGAGCDEVQGFFVARPMPADEFIRWKSNWEAERSAAPRYKAETQRRSYSGETGAIKLVQLVWHQAYECGHPLIDEQHKLLFEDANMLLDAILSGLSIDELALLGEALIRDVAQHFKDEEAVIAAAGFPGAAAHAEIHRELVAIAVALVNRLQAGTLSIGELFQFLAHDLVARHMLGADREFFPYL